MTKEEAINMLKSKMDGHTDTSYEWAETVRMVIKALEQEPCPNAISRSDMIDAVGHGTTYTSEELQNIIKALPPVNAPQWETCFECPLSHGCPKIKGCTNEQAIEHASKIPNDCPLSAQPQPKTGHWIYDEEYSDWYYINYKCSCCKRVISVLYEKRNEVYKEYPYCHCGAKMIEPQESEE